MSFRLACFLMLILGCDIPIIEAFDHCIYEAVQLIVRSTDDFFPYYKKNRITNWSGGRILQNENKKDSLWNWWAITEDK